MFRKYFKRELRSTIFWRSEEEAVEFINVLSKMGYKWNRDYKEIVKETSPYSGTSYVVWTYIPETKWRRAMNKLHKILEELEKETE